MGGLDFLPKSSIIEINCWLGFFQLNGKWIVLPTSSDMSLFESRSFAVRFLISKSTITYICIKVNSTPLDDDIFSD